MTRARGHDPHGPLSEPIFGSSTTRRDFLRLSLFGGASMLVIPAVVASRDNSALISNRRDLAASPILVRLGQDAQLTGDQATYGLESKRGVAVATAAVNKIGKYRYDVTLLDDASTTQGAVTNIEKLLSEDMKIIFGPQTSDQSEAASPRVGAAGDLQFTINLDPNYPKDNKYGFAIAPTGQSQGVYAANFALSRKQTQVATITENSPVGQELLQGFLAQAKVNKQTVVDSETYSLGDTTFGAQVGRILAAKPQYIQIGSTAYTEPALIAIALRAANVPDSVTIADYNAIHNATYLKLAGKAGEGVLCFDEKPANTTYTKRANALYEAAYGEPPLFPPVSMAYYDAVNWLTEAFEATGTTTNMPMLAGWIKSQKTLTTYFGDSTFIDQRLSWPQFPYIDKNNQWIPYTG
jgi:branched-chain amino acid transport system substrate-binding protein